MNNAIRQLRHALPNPRGNKPLSQAQLAEITDVPLDSLRGIEAGRQAFSPRMKNRIRCATAAVWNEQDQCWHFWEKDGPRYQQDHYLQYREAISRDVEGALPFDAFLAALRIKLLMETLSPEAEIKFLFRLNSFLENNRKEFCPDRFVELFEDASSYIEAYPGLAFRRYPQRLARILKLAPGTPAVIDWFVKKLNPADYEIIQQPQLSTKKRRKKVAAVSSE
jgi:transcriptional regulator with XRE-family HTH domain